VVRLKVLDNFVVMIGLFKVGTII